MLPGIHKCQNRQKFELFEVPINWKCLRVVIQKTTYELLTNIILFLMLYSKSDTGVISKPYVPNAPLPEERT